MSTVYEDNNICRYCKIVLKITFHFVENRICTYVNETLKQNKYNNRARKKWWNGETWDFLWSSFIIEPMSGRIKRNMSNNVLTLKKSGFQHSAGKMQMSQRVRLYYHCCLFYYYCLLIYIFKFKKQFTEQEI